MNIFKLIFKTKKKFFKPKQKKILFFDILNVHLFKSYFLDQNQIEFLATRKEEINIYICFLLLFKRKKINGKNYFLEYIKIVKPKLIISFTDNHIFLYELKDFIPDIKVLTIQNGIRNESLFRNLENSSKKLKADLIMTWGNNISQIYKKFIDTKTITIGSFKNNLIKKKDLQKKKTIAFISTGYERENNLIEISKNKYVPESEYYKPEKKLLPILSKICKEKNFTLEIIGRCGHDSKKEKLFYKDIIGHDNFNYYPKGDETCYIVSDQAGLCVNIYSSFGLEVLARDNKCCFINVRGQQCNEESMNCFWPGEFEKKGDFWTNELSYEEISRVVSFGLDSNEKTWNKSLKNIFPNLIFFDKNNKIFQESIKKLFILE